MISDTGLKEQAFALPSSAATGVVGPIVAIQEQKKSEWCWAAVSVSVASLKSAPPYTEQCELAYATYQATISPPSHDDCCGDCSDGPCNQPVYGSWLAGTAGAPSPLSIAGIAAAQPARTNNSISDAAIIAALTAGKAVCIVINWPGGNSHFVAIVGARQSGGVQQFLVGDPIDGSQAWLNRADIDAYHSHTSEGVGTWGDTYVTI